MTLWILLLCAVGMTVAQALFPGQAVYHTGWYNALDIGFFVLAALQPRKPLIALFGCAIVVLSGAAAGLMGADTHQVVGAPGASARDAEVGGAFVFPIDKRQPVQLQRGGHTVTIGSGRRYSGSFIMWQTPRTVVYVDAADAAGNHLTITQPTNATFLSPVLLMQQSTTIAGMNVNYDTFSVPALRRNVKAVLFTEQQAAQLRSNPPVSGKPAVLFAVSDNADHVVPGGLGLVVSGGHRRIGGLTLGARVGTYPAIVVASGPYLPVLAIGLIVALAGVIRPRWRT